MRLRRSAEHGPVRNFHRADLTRQPIRDKRVQDRGAEYQASVWTQRPTYESARHFAWPRPPVPALRTSGPGGIVKTRKHENSKTSQRPWLARPGLPAFQGNTPLRRAVKCKERMTARTCAAGAFVFLALMALPAPSRSFQLSWMQPARPHAAAKGSPRITIRPAASLLRMATEDGPAPSEDAVTRVTRREPTGPGSGGGVSPLLQSLSESQAPTIRASTLTPVRSRISGRPRPY